ncbi:T9SS type A sorting domain-containing protein [bacterium SCSIO 12741]|nr:T9SS type A sorting domain-containing protein [bacterium SCSIO 12741]
MKDFSLCTRLFIGLLLLAGNQLLAQGPFAPAADQPGTKAIHKDSSIFVSWASEATVHRGFINIAFPQKGRTTHGETWYALGKANPEALSLGDSGYVTVSFNGTVTNGAGPDFAVFENSFNHTFLELAFVEVSSDGINFTRFPAESHTDTTSQIGSFDALDATNLYNLAGKYKGLFGTPFDLEEVKGSPGLNVDSITHIRIVDVVGSMDARWKQRDSKGRPVNDPYPTDFEVSGIYTGGFDLNAVGLIHYQGETFLPVPDFWAEESNLQLFPNPATDRLYLKGSSENVQLTLMDRLGRMSQLNRMGEGWSLDGFSAGVYSVIIQTQDGQEIQKVVLR